MTLVSCILYSVIFSPVMYAAYSVLTVAFFVVVSPYFLYQALRYRKYITNLRATVGLSSGVVQPRRRRVDLDPRRVGRRGPHGARAAAGAARALPASADLPVDDDDDRPADRPQQSSVRRRGVLLPVRPRVHRQAHAAAGEAPALHHDGDGDLAEPAARLPSRRREDGARQRPHLVAVVSAVPARPALLPSRPPPHRPLLHAERRVGAPHRRHRRSARPGYRHRLAEVRLARAARTDRARSRAAIACCASSACRPTVRS